MGLCTMNQITNRILIIFLVNTYFWTLDTQTKLSHKCLSWVQIERIVYKLYVIQSNGNWLSIHQSLRWILYTNQSKSNTLYGSWSSRLKLHCLTRKPLSLTPLNFPLGQSSNVPRTWKFCLSSLYTIIFSDRQFFCKCIIFI